ncbi:N-fatty-acyl-amino acid synthase/hydrolase PM20D1.2-like [Dendronephthya gigantea]|uniref:N-fatty-acyl-amino acid synthase/hydrolase PM20D1.2-like n=1 Tax=Dendronephthya gigantea TaxID=151771 RepID=UPI00106A2414|nr:N-fatty-acyl-amino acid synthase/hydrolase PM20D1.2-like [Dendronephthya gigantea]
MATFHEQVQKALLNVGIGAASVLTVISIFLIKGVIHTTFQTPKKRSKNKENSKYIHLNDEILSRFSKAIQCETVSYSQHETEGPSCAQELLKLHAVIKDSFPHVHLSPLVQCDVINKYSLLYTIKGSDPSLKPYLLISHLDVVPVKDQTWDVPQFEGLVKDGYIWGRGTLDVKNGVMGSLEALEFLLKSGHLPNRGFFLAFGHDEEIFGWNGAAYIVKELVARGVSLEFVQDEGLMIIDNLFPGITAPIASIGIAEKGSISLELRVDTAVGHASMPPRESSIGILSKAITRIEGNPLPSTFGCGPEVDMLLGISPAIPLPLRIVTSNMWFFKPLLVWILSKNVTTNALVRTTVAVTKINGGTKDNVIPASATAHLNIRIHQGDTVESVIRHLRSCINDDRVQIKTLEAHSESPIASCDSKSFGYNTVASSILDVFPDVIVAPGLLVAGTDSKHFLQLTSEVYRFMPSHIKMEDVSRIHGSNERISVKNYEETINFYYRLMLNADKAML